MMKVGAEYEYVQRQLFGVSAGGAGGAAVRTDENVVMTSLRYYPF